MSNALKRGREAAAARVSIQQTRRRGGSRLCIEEKSNSIYSDLIGSLADQSHAEQSPYNLLAALILSDRVWTRSPLATILKAVSVFEILFNVLTLVAVTCELTEPFLPLGPSVVAAVETLQLMCNSLIIGFQMARNQVLALLCYDMVCCSCTVRLGVFPSGDVLITVFVGLALFCCGLAVPRMFEDSPIILSLWPAEWSHESRSRSGHGGEDSSNF